ncbi:MAG: ATP-binding protein [Saprospiraceae bacterium]|nr:ATP-binding protein [Saprospiraceae bacterium]
MTARTKKEIFDFSPIMQLFDYLESVVVRRLELFFKKDASPLPLMTDLSSATDPLSMFIKSNNLNQQELIALLIGIVPHFKADFFDNLIQSFFKQPVDFLQIGGIRGKQFRGFLPTGETVLFVIAGEDWVARQEAMLIFSDDHLFKKQNILTLDAPLSNEPLMSGLWHLEDDWAVLFTTGHSVKPRFSATFPAERLETGMDWQDLVLPKTTKEEINELRIWLAHGDTLFHDWQMKRYLKPGYRALFHGAAGTGKTLTAALLGKETGRDVYRVDLSRVVSKFIGETEKNLSNLFERAENKDWILFFDEADALFGKRTGVRDAHDRYANQEVSYLLQRVEIFNGLVILASNFKSNIDEAFIRRFQSIIHFPVPRTSERLQLWQQSVPKHISLAEDVNLKFIAEKYELTGAAIVNIVQFCCLRALSQNNLTLTIQDFRDGIAREFGKEGKLFS